MSEPTRSNADVRMRGFSRRTPVADAIAWLDAQIERTTALPGRRMGENVPLREAAGRVLSADVVSGVDVPSFDRAMMDGFALRAADTQGASPYNRLTLAVVGQSMPGHPFAGAVAAGQAVRIMTGAPLPTGADAVLPAEWVDIEDRQILAQGDVSPGQHVARVGEDISSGTTVLTRGRVLRPQDIGLLASIGVGQPLVRRRPRVRVVVTGNELLPAGSMPAGCKIVDSNGPMLGALVTRDGGLPTDPGIVSDTPEAILAAMRSDADVVLVSGGSSVGQEDHAPSLLQEHGELAIHGIAMRPSSPTGLGTLGGRLVFLLPGNPVSCLCAYDFYAGRAIRALGGRSIAWPYRRVVVPLRHKIVSTVGRLDYMRVRLVDAGAEPLAIGGSSILSSTTRADGFVLVPPDSEGYPPGGEIEVYLYDRE